MNLTKKELAMITKWYELAAEVEDLSDDDVTLYDKLNRCTSGKKQSNQDDDDESFDVMNDYKEGFGIYGDDEDDPDYKY